jgi:hypothetical protein
LAQKQWPSFPNKKEIFHLTIVQSLAIENQIIISSNAIRFLHYCGTGTALPSGAPEFKSVFIVVRITQSLALCVCFVDRCLSFCTLSFCHCVVCSSSIYGF